MSRVGLVWPVPQPQPAVLPGKREVEPRMGTALKGGAEAPPLPPAIASRAAGKPPPMCNHHWQELKIREKRTE